MLETLESIATRHGTDKASWFHDYASVYDEMFGHLRDQPIRILEIGVLRGASLRMWLDGFPQATVHGVDIDVSNADVRDPRLTLWQFDAASDDLAKLAAGHGPFDIVIEDSLHRVEVTRPIVETLFPHHIRPGGWLVIEDTNSGWSIKKKGPRIVHRNNDALHDYAKSMVDAVNRHRWIGKTLEVWPEVSQFDAELRQVVYRPKLCMLQRKFA